MKYFTGINLLFVGILWDKQQKGDNKGHQRIKKNSWYLKSLWIDFIIYLEEKTTDPDIAVNESSIMF